MWRADRVLCWAACGRQDVRVAERVRVREIGRDEGRRLLRIIRRGTGSVVTWRRAQMVLLSAQAMPVAKIAEVTFTSPDRVRDVIHYVGTTVPPNRSGRPTNTSRTTATSTPPRPNSLLRLTIGYTSTTMIGGTPPSGCSARYATSNPDRRSKSCLNPCPLFGVNLRTPPNEAPGYRRKVGSSAMS